MITIEELIKIQNVSSSRSKNPGVLVIPKHKLADLINRKIDKPFNRKHLNIAVKLYCKRGYAIRMNLGKKKYNLIAETIPGFLQWFFKGLEQNNLYDKICTEYEKDSLTGYQHIKKRGLVKSPSNVNPET